MKRTLFINNAINRNKLPKTVLVFSKDEKKIYFHYGPIEIPDSMDRKTFHTNFTQSEQPTN